MIVWNWCYDLLKKIGWFRNVRIVLIILIKIYCVIIFLKYFIILLFLIFIFDFLFEEEDLLIIILILCFKGWFFIGVFNCLEVLIFFCKIDVLFFLKLIFLLFIFWWLIFMVFSILDFWFVRWEVEEKSVVLNFVILEFDEKLLEWLRCMLGYKLFELFLFL